MKLSAEERAVLIQRYADGPRRLRTAFDAVPTAARQWRPSPGKWSAHEVIVHCADSESNGALRLRYLLAEKAPTIMGYDQDAWAATLDYHAQLLDSAFAAVESARARTLPLLRTLPEAAWARSGTHSESGAYSVEKWLQVYADHLETHARQIERNLSAWQARGRA